MLFLKSYYGQGKNPSAIPKIKTKAQEKVYVHSSKNEMENRRQKVNDNH